MQSLPVVGTSPCDACISTCCRGFNLVIQGFDAYRLGRNLKLPLADFVELRWTETPDEDHRIVLDAREEQRGYYRMLLLRVPDKQGDMESRCVFLITVGTRGRCGVYASRPTMCAAYPSHFSNGLVGSNGGKYCPPGAWNIESMDVPLFHARHLFKRRQQIIYDRLVDGWNARVLGGNERRSSAEFYKFLVFVYSELERRQPAWFVELKPGEADGVERDVLCAEVEHALADLGWPAPPLEAAPVEAAPAPATESRPAELVLLKP
jgi:Fe-S-cluster containining protein